jgi:hypothetical protein
MILRTGARPAKPHRSAAGLLTLLFATLLFAACALPGLTVEPVPTTDANILHVIVVATAAAAGTQTAAALPPTPLPTITPTLTATPASIFSSDGTALLPDEGGASLFIDQAAGYRLRVPAGWLLVRINQPELERAFALPEAADPKVRNFLTEVQKYDARGFRLFGADILPAHAYSGFISNFNVFWEPGSSASLEQIVGRLDEELPRTALNASVTSRTVSFTALRVPIGIVESSSTLYSAEGWPVHLFQKQAVFRLSSGALSVLLSTTHEQKNDYLPEFNAMVDQLVLLEQ